MINKSPFFSVIIPLYNKEKYIKDTITSVLNQTFTNFEIIIVNDGSTDNSASIVKTFNDVRIKLHSQNNQGLSRSRNNAIHFAQGNYMAFIDADDCWKENHLDQLHNLIVDFPNHGLYATRYTLKKTETIYHEAKYNNLPQNFRGVVPNFFKHSIQHCIAWVGAMCIPKNVLKTVGYFDTEIYSEQDTDLYIKINLKYKTVLDATKTTAIYNRTMDDNMSNFSEKVSISKFLSAYKKEEKTFPYLNKFMDLNRFSTVIFFKLSDNKTLERELKKEISLNNLSSIQKLILILPNPILRFLFKVKDTFKLNPFLVFKQKL